MPEKQQERLAFSREEIADIFGLHMNDISRAIHSGALPAKKPGRSYRILLADAKAWFDGLPSA